MWKLDRKVMGFQAGRENAAEISGGVVKENRVGGDVVAVAWGSCLPIFTTAWHSSV